MALNDVKIVEKGAGTVQKFLVDDRTTSGASATIKAGEPVKFASDGSPFVILLATGDPEIGTDQFVGIATEESTETSTADGSVMVFVPAPNSILECKATTSTNFDTQSEIDALVGDTVAFDLTGGTFTVDENEGHDDNVHGLRILGGDPDLTMVRFSVKPAAMHIDSAL